MSVENVKKAISIIEDHQDEADFDGAKDESLLVLAERYLGLNFPMSYRFFLQEFGCGDFAGHEFYGVIKPDFEHSGIPDAVWLTQKERQRSKLPDNFVVIYSFGDGDYAVLDCGTDNVDFNKVLKWSPGSEEQLSEVINDDFGDFFYKKIYDAVN